MTIADAERHLVIIGGGIAGLSAAYYAQQAGLRYTLLEASRRWGGKVHTERIDIGLGQPLVIEGGPDGFITRKPWALALVRKLGLHERLVAVNTLPKRILVLSRGRLVPLPEGLRLLVPTKLGPFLRSPLFTWPGKLRVLADLVIPPQRQPDDEALAAFITRRFGAEAVQRLGEPLLAGVYNADPERMSIQATFPNYPQLERQYGSLIRGMWRTTGTAQKSTEPALVSFIGGMGELVDSLRAALHGDLRLATRINEIEKAAVGYRVQLADGTHLNASHVFVATQANHAAQLLRKIAPRNAEALAQIRYEGVASTTFAFRAPDVPHPLDAFGVVISGGEGRHIDGMQWATSKWPERAPDGVVLIRVFFGGPQTRAMLHREDDDLLPILRQELQDLLGIQAEALYHKTLRWPDGYPQYDVDHLQRIQAVFAGLPSNLMLMGNAYGGVGLPDTVRGAREAVEHITNNSQ